MTREEWLQAAVAELQPLFKEHGASIPEVHVSVGFPSKSATSSKSRRIGECWSGAASADGRPHIFITPLIGDRIEALGVLVHECIHACTPGAGHKGEFARIAKAIGLEGKMTATTVGAGLRARLNDLASRIGPFPHSALAINPSAKKQSTRLLKAECLTCGYTIRLTKKWADQGLPTCVCGDEFALDGKDDDE